LKNQDFDNADGCGVKSEKTAPLLDVEAVFSDSNVLPSAKSKTDSSTCLGIHSFFVYCALIRVSIKSQMQHRASFLMETGANFLASMTDIFGIWVLFDRFHMIQGWTLQELALIYGIIHIGFAISEAIGRGFEKFSRVIIIGDFDRVLLRPLGSLLQIAASRTQLLKIGRLLQGLVVLVWGFFELHLSFFSLHTIVILLSIIGTTALFYGLFVIQATLAFWTTETLELMNISTYGGRETGQFPITIFPDGLRLFFTCIIPLACVVYYPIATLLQHESFPVWATVVSPFSGIVFLCVSFQLWNLGVRHYHSTGN
jgi:ABC-2 type transport system permease protein